MKKTTQFWKILRNYSSMRCAVTHLFCVFYMYNIATSDIFFLLFSKLLLEFSSNSLSWSKTVRAKKCLPFRCWSELEVLHSFKLLQGEARPPVPSLGKLSHVRSEDFSIQTAVWLPAVAQGYRLPHSFCGVRHRDHTDTKWQECQRYVRLFFSMSKLCSL